MNVAPVLIVTYDRLEHLKQTISSLQSNIYAKKTDLFIASDFQRSDLEANKITAVRKYLKTISGFKSVTVFVRKKNYGVVENCNLALQFIFDQFDQFIIMNDDLVTAPGFLKFINEALERYGEKEDVFSITGYCPPITIHSSYQFDGFFLNRMSAWGCGMTKKKYDSVCEITRNEFDEFVADKKLSHAFVKNGGKDLLVMLKDVAYGSLEAWDVRCMYTQFIKKQYTLYPTQSLVQNIGFDGTGMHCGITDRFNVSLSNKVIFNLPQNVIIDSQIVKANRLFRDGNALERFKIPVISKVLRKIKRLFSSNEFIFK